MGDDDLSASRALSPRMHTTCSAGADLAAKSAERTSELRPCTRRCPLLFRRSQKALFPFFFQCFVFPFSRSGWAARKLCSCAADLDRPISAVRRGVQPHYPFLLLFSATFYRAVDSLGSSRRGATSS